MTVLGESSGGVDEFLPTTDLFLLLLSGFFLTKQRRKSMNGIGLQCSCVARFFRGFDEDDELKTTVATVRGV